MSWMYSSASPPLRCVPMPVIGLLGKESETGWQHCRCTKSLQSLPPRRHCFGGERTDMTLAWQTVGVSCGCHSWYIPHVHWRRWHYRQKNLRINSWTPSEPSACLKTCCAFADCRIHGNASESWTEQQWRELVRACPNETHETHETNVNQIEEVWWSTADGALLKEHCRGTVRGAMEWSWARWWPVLPAGPALIRTGPSFCHEHQLTLPAPYMRCTVR